MSEQGTKFERPILLAAGGTGGHLFPAEALSNALSARGYAIELFTDSRAEKYGGAFPARAIHIVSSASPRSASLLSRASAALALARGTFEARRLIKRIRPLALVGFGGYPSVPPVLAATQLGVPTVLHEGNAVIGKANLFLSPRVDAIAKGFETLKGVSAAIAAKAHLTGDPVRPMVIEAAKIPFPDFAGGKLRLLVTGGSQGARIMSDVVPGAIELLPEEARKMLILVQQARPEDEERVRAVYRRLGVEAEVKSFFSDLPRRIAASHLVIARAGASTVSELAVIGRPAILVPLPHALDQDQAANAEQFALSGAALVVAQSAFSPQWLANAISSAQNDAEGLARRAAAAKGSGIADAADRLADLVLRVAADTENKTRR
ncbi:undecaprenyldiphospho-muramoylpentapeptide beta-N-acetylglucosaminyltransferase [Methylocella tundrae]|uniref:UDP-N-acetylglucosamine--N-acetylmuramyl-(pentapeptide) pyrophosphoryl-undecaprenol N-acetylglucosamine transferase n=1 Tax=Methylocella tundrae TaxID=227605 RepID=A0A4U8YZM6_METTU|nr:undecaprenyldiphospho-muramoylpentapeptide beta-N-acetylglucosaminyltransferase [Methylocella tundrae]WPP06099.1 undecaprenyldiphospho-muramoylpentapeptide beta-N-acetylglucosaminyltransferase [Methylocella tundrae]VFU08705.1 UDP-N-acetylglucosamine--N-acetylmuramyl-(pentapeptide) pyrophosphoryl-undecaprenol N-acetylglucosamine transferase [Methylocella tundrae]